MLTVADVLLTETYIHILKCVLVYYGFSSKLKHWQMIFIMIYLHRHIYIYIYIYIQTDRKKDRQTDRQTNR